MASICNALSCNAPSDQLPIETHPSICTRIMGIALMILAMVPVVVLYSVALIGSFFGECACVEELQKLTDKIFAMTLGHGVGYVNCEDTLCSTKNLATREDIWNEEDAKLGSAWVGQLELENRQKVEGSLVKGICLGATLSIIKEVQSSNIQNEEELIACIAKYQEGFSVEASALQMAYQAVAFDIKKQFDVLNDQFEQSTNREERYRIAKEMTDIFTNVDHRRISKVAPFLNLELDTKKEITEKGCYCISSERHAVALLNLDFGTYVVDPTYGLYRWDAPRQESYKDFTKVVSFKQIAS